MKKLLLVFSVCIFVPLMLSAQLLRSMKRIPDTGQTMSYTLSYGEDHDFTIFPPHLMNNGNGTVTDTITGLMWQQTDGGEMIYENAILYCDSLILGGQNDWRLPTAKESFSILNHQRANPALDTLYFSNTGAEYWWSSDPQVNDSSKIWVTNAGGGIGNHAKSESISAGGTKKIHVRAVRNIDPPGTLSQRFSNIMNGSITDYSTDLQWQSVSWFDSLTWENALIYADTCTLAGWSDWRLPNIREIESLSDVDRFNPCVDTAYFPNIGQKKYWSSTTLPNQISRAWYLDTRYGITTYISKTSRLNVLLVRGNVNAQPVSTAEIPANEPLMIYPNPFHCCIHVSYKNSHDMVRVLDFSGKTIYEGNALQEMDFSNLVPGPYLFKVDGKLSYSRIIIKN